MNLEQPIEELPGSRPAVALTFDDGPDPVFTRRMLDILIDRGIEATFFVLGDQAERHGEVIHELRDAGMGLGVHSWTHRDLSASDPAVAHVELSRTVELLRGAGVVPTLFRPPYGSWNAELVRTAAGLGLRTVLWSVDPRDWDDPGPVALAERVEAELRPGAIVLMHDGGGSRSAGVGALPRIIRRGIDAGLSWVELGRALDDARDAARPA